MAKTTTVGTKVESKTHQRLVKRAARAGLTVSEVLRLLIEDANASSVRSGNYTAHQQRRGQGAYGSRLPVWSRQHCVQRGASGANV